MQQDHINALTEENIFLKKQQMAIANSMDGIALLDAEGKYYYLNEVHLKMFGYDNEAELIGKTWKDIYGPEEITRIETALFPLLMANGKWMGETLGLTKDGKPVFQEISLTGLPDGGLICICRDIAQKKEDQELLRLQQQVLQTTSAIVMVTNADRKIEWVNDSFLNITGYTEEEVMGKNPGKLLQGKETDPDTIQYMRDQLKLGNDFTCEVLNYKKDKTPYWIELRCHPLFNGQGKIERYFSIEENITERKQTERKFKENSIRLEYAMEAANGALWEWDMISNTVFYSVQWKKILGYEEHELSNDFSEWKSRVHPDDLQRVMGVINDYLAGKTPIYKTYTRIRHKKGHYLHWLDGGLISERNKKGEAIRMVGAAIDVTELRETQVKLKESEERLELALEGSGAGIWEWDLDNKKFSFSTRHKEILGFKKTDVLKEEYEFWIPMIHPDDTPNITNALVKHWKGELDYFDCEFRCKNNQQEYIWLEVRGVVSKKDATGRVSKMIGSAYNIQDKKISQEKLKDSESRWNFALEGSGAGIWDWNLVTDTIFYSQKALDMVDYSVDKSLTPIEAHRSIIHPDDLTVVQEWVDLMGKHTDKVKVQYRIKGKKQPYIWIEDNAMVLTRDTKGIPQRILGSFTDITERKNTELELIRSKEFAETLVRKERKFLANISHELRTPLHAVIGLSGQLEQSNLTEKQKEFVNIINGSARHLMELISNVLDLSKIAEGKILLENTEFSFTKILKESIRLVEKASRKKDLLFKTAKCDFTNDHPVQGDPLRLKQIFLNILSNSIKFTEKGYIEVEYKVRVDHKNISHFEIRFTDTGIGMDDKMIATLFEDYVQGDESYARKYGGSGLGLSITRKIVELMNGSINLASKKDIGTTIILDIPFQKAVASTKMPLKPADILSTQKELRILLAEDNAINRLVATTILNKYEIYPDEVINGREVIEKLESGKEYDIILMDIQMPEMDGIEASRYIRNELKLNVPIIAVTANAVKEELELYVRDGMNDYITKPFEEVALIQKIGQWSQQ